VGWQAEQIRRRQQPRHIMPIAKPLQSGTGPLTSSP